MLSQLLAASPALSACSTPRELLETACDTVVPGVKFASIVPRMARELKRYALLRGWNPKNAGHGVADQYVLSGRPVNPAVIHPCYGSVVSLHKGFKTRMPPFVQLGDQVDRTNGGGTCGYLGQEHNPFEILSDPSAGTFTVRDITRPKGVDGGRLYRRKRADDSDQAVGSDQQYRARAGCQRQYHCILPRH